VFLAAALIMIGYGDGIALFVARSLGASSGKVTTTWKVLEWMLLLALVLMVFNLLYIFAPNVKHRRWHWLMPGTVLGVTLWIAASYGFKIYLSFFNSYNLTYGSIAAVIILLFWFYLSGIAILLGGELNSEIEKRTGRLESPEVDSSTGQNA
jgi:membrane protein